MGQGSALRRAAWAQEEEKVGDGVSVVWKTDDIHGVPGLDWYGDITGECDDTSSVGLHLGQYSRGQVTWLETGGPV